jgi:hypothetical protein
MWSYIKYYTINLSIHLLYWTGIWYIGPINAVTIVGPKILGLTTGMVHFGIIPKLLTYEKKEN